MGPPLKGKKAWRKHIDSTQVEQFLEDASHQARRGPNVESLQDSDLFFVDKGADVEAAEDVATGRRKRKQRDTQLRLRSTAILQQASSAQPVMVQKPVRKVNTVLKKVENEFKGRRPRFAALPVGQLDIWNQDSQVPCTAAASWAPEPTSGNQLHKLGTKAASRPVDRKLPSRVKAVEVDMAGCSYNPDHEEHQDALAVLVAAEMKAVLQQELAPKAPPKIVDLLPGEEVLDEVMRLQVEATQDEDENEIHVSEDEDNGGAVTRRGRGERKTQKDRNRDKRRVIQEKEQAERQLLKRQRQDLEQLNQLKESMGEEAEQQGMKRQRRQTVKEEKAATLPARLGRHKFEPPSVQVATTEELGGSLRRVKPCPMVALHRYKSLQHRGLIEPRKPVLARTGKKVFYEKGLRTEKAVAAQVEIEEIQKKRKQATKKSKKAKKVAARSRVL